MFGFNYVNLKINMTYYRINTTYINNANNCNCITNVAPKEQLEIADKIL